MDTRKRQEKGSWNVCGGSGRVLSLAFTSVWHPSIQRRNRSTSGRRPTKATGLVWVVHSPHAHWQKKGHGACVPHDKDIHGLFYFASVPSSKDAGESVIVNPGLSRYPFSSGRAHQRQYKIHALTLSWKIQRRMSVRDMPPQPGTKMQFVSRQREMHSFAKR